MQEENHSNRFIQQLSGAFEKPVPLGVQDVPRAPPERM